MTRINSTISCARTRRNAASCVGIPISAKIFPDDLWKIVSDIFAEVLTGVFILRAAISVFLYAQAGDPSHEHVLKHNISNSVYLSNCTLTGFKALAPYATRAVICTPNARATFTMVSKRGLDFGDSALYKLSRPSPDTLATRDMPRARAT